MMLRCLTDTSPLVATRLFSVLPVACGAEFRRRLPPREEGASAAAKKRPNELIRDDGSSFAPLGATARHLFSKNSRYSPSVVSMIVILCCVSICSDLF